MANVHIWMSKNQLKLNEDKSELLLITTKRQVPKNNGDKSVAIKIGNDKTPPNTPKNLVFM